MMRMRCRLFLCVLFGLVTPVWAGGSGEEAFDVSECVLYFYGDSNDVEAAMYPDRNARLFVTMFPALYGTDREGAHFELRGHFPLTRYFVWTNYKNGGGALIDLLPDNVIVPTEGVNPTMKGGGGFAAMLDSPRNTYTITIQDVPPQERTTPKPENTIWGGFDDDGVPVGVNMLTMRYYGLHPLREDAEIPDQMTPEAWQNQGQVPLPRVYYVIDDEARAPYHTQEEVCRAVQNNGVYIDAFEQFIFRLDAFHDTIAPILEKTKRGAHKAGFDPAQWFIAAAPNMRKALLYPFPHSVFASLLFRLSPMFSKGYLESNYFPNWNSGYLGTILNPNYGEIFVFRIKNRRFPRTESGEEIEYGSWTPVADDYTADPRYAVENDFHQVRYWSLCIYQYYQFAVSNCLQDRQVKLDPDGYATVVVSAREDRPQKDPVLGAEYNWLEWDSPVPNLILREIYVHPGYVDSSYWYKTACEADPSYRNRNCHYDNDAIARHMKAYFPVSTYCTKEAFERNRCGIMRDSLP